MFGPACQREDQCQEMQHPLCVYLRSLLYTSGSSPLQAKHYYQYPQGLSWTILKTELLSTERNLIVERALSLQVTLHEANSVINYGFQS